MCQHRGEVRVLERIAARGCCVETTSCRPRIGQVFHDLRYSSVACGSGVPGLVCRKFVENAFSLGLSAARQIDGEIDYSTQLDDVKLVARSAAG